MGIAAGIRGRVELGDVVIPEQIYYYESSKVIAEGELIAPMWKSTDARVRRAVSVFPVVTDLGGAGAVRVNTDCVIASGEKVVASDEFRIRLDSAHRKLAAIDMESYGVACAAERCGARFTVIKGISDFADASKNNDYNDVAARASAGVFEFLVREGKFGPSFDDDWLSERLLAGEGAYKSLAEPLQRCLGLH
jgi:nucleoside phosphorylase